MVSGGKNCYDLRMPILALIEGFEDKMDDSSLLGHGRRLTVTSRKLGHLRCLFESLVLLGKAPRQPFDNVQQ